MEDGFRWVYAYHRTAAMAPAGYQTDAVLAKVLAAASVAAAVPSRSGYLTDVVVQNHVEHGYLNTADRSALLSGDNYLYFP